MTAIASKTIPLTLGQQFTFTWACRDNIMPKRIFTVIKIREAVISGETEIHFDASGAMLNGDKDVAVWCFPEKSLVGLAQKKALLIKKQEEAA